MLIRPITPRRDLVALAGEGDPLAPARGVLIGLLGGLLMWSGILWSGSALLNR
jgi:hypothetical protein